LSSYRKFPSDSIEVDRRCAYFEFTKASASLCDTFSECIPNLLDFGNLVALAGGNAPACILNYLVKVELVGLILLTFGDLEAFSLFTIFGLVLPL
jgi:hypothetical protein